VFLMATGVVMAFAGFIALGAAADPGGIGRAAAPVEAARSRARARQEAGARARARARHRPVLGHGHGQRPPRSPRPALPS
jgi:hypothetical protein